MCIKNNLRTIAFPCIATGVNGFDHEKAANIALGTVRAFLETDILCGKDTVKQAIWLAGYVDLSCTQSVLIPGHALCRSTELCFVSSPI